MSTQENAQTGAETLGKFRDGKFRDGEFRDGEFRDKGGTVERSDRRQIIGFREINTGHLSTEAA
ncbi:MAG: hypothetical protein Q8M16_12350 [Pirellulaceae bacterium]|nr:hypothetical protein [Pirellulaceae bacterium]